MYSVISTSLNPASRSRGLAKAAVQQLQDRVRSVELVDLSAYDWPLHDGSNDNSEVAERVKRKIGQATGVVLVLPVYRNTLAVGAMNMLQQTSKVWQRKVVGLISVAADGLSHSATLGFANSLMLEYRTFVIPDFVFVDSKSLTNGSLDANEKLSQQLRKMTKNLVRVTEALKTA